MKKIISVILAVSILLSLFVPIIAFAAENDEYTIYITEKQMKKKAGKYIDDALWEAHERATKKKPVTVVIPSGKYTLEKTLHIYSNTILKLQSDTVLVRSADISNMLKAGRAEEVNSGYNGYVNIVVNGGVWDGNFSSDSCGMRFAHCKNVTLKNLTIKNIKNSHHMELAASKDFTIVNCTFTGYKRNGAGDGEAIQIDPLHNTEHFPSYMYYDDTPCKNITVKGCYFNDLYAGVGTRSGVVGSYFENIRIVDNIFDNIADKAICGFNYRNSAIKNNMINSATLGIILEYFPSYNVTAKMFNPNDSSADKTIIQDTNTVISGNSINITKKTFRVNTGGILVYGAVNTKKMSKENHFPVGRYVPTGLRIKNNEIITNSALSRGIYFDRADECKIYNNRIVCKAEAGEDINGIRLINSSRNVMRNNIIKGYYNGVYLEAKSAENVFRANTLKSNSQYGIRIDKKASGIIYADNVFRKNTQGAIRIRKRVFKMLTAAPEIESENSKEGIGLKWNEYKDTSGYNIYRSKRKNKGYRLLTTVIGGENTTFRDSDVKAKRRYYYKAEPFITFRNTVIFAPKSISTTKKAL